MYVIFTAVEYNQGTTEEAAVQALKEGLIPMIKQAPGFVKGEWFGDDKHGHTMVVFETEEQAKPGVQQVGEVFMGVTVTSSAVYRLHAEA